MKHTNTKKNYHLLEIQINSTCKQGIYLQLVPSCVFICALCICTGNVHTVLGSGKQKRINTASGPPEAQGWCENQP